MHDVLIIGGGVIGLSLAWDLARHGQKVHVIDQGEPGREASWAGAGILPAAVRRAGQHPYEQLAGLASELHPRWAADLQAATGIDNGYRRCGGLYLARTHGESAALAAWATAQRDEGIEIERLTAEQVAEMEPKLAVGVNDESEIRTPYSVRSTQYSVPSTKFCFLVPGEAQLRNPRHLRALAKACHLADVTIASQTAAAHSVITANEVAAIETSAGPVRARQYCFTAGAWTGQLLGRLGIAVGIVPIRGQMVLFRSQRPLLDRIVTEGSRYLVPRGDGRLLAGSTEEEAGFDKRTTESAIAELIAFARGLVPALAQAEVERTWAGLRPGSFDGLPYLGRLSGLSNAFVASGHFRSGLFLSPATAVVMGQLLRGEQPEIDLAPFRVGR
jgi:glycine oxidase